MISQKPIDYSMDQAMKKARLSTSYCGIRRRPTLPDRYQSSTIGTEGLNFCVRYGNRWDPFVIATGNGELFSYLTGKRSLRSRSSLVWFIRPFSLPFLPLQGPLGCFHTLTTAQLRFRIVDLLFRSSNWTQNHF